MTSTILPLSDPYGPVAARISGEGEPLVLIHGVGMQSAAWAPQIEALAKTHKVIALDMPGHGGSAALPRDAQLPEFVEWLHAVITALDLGPVNLAGHSMGALVSGGYAVSHPDMVRRVALLNGVYCRNATARAAVISRAREIGQGAFDLETPLTRWFGQSEADQAAAQLVADWLSQVDIEGYATAYGAFAHGDATYADRIENITCPFLALTADGDLNSSPDMSRAMAEQVQNGRAEVIEGHRHMVNLTAPDQVNKILQDWLNSPVSGGEQ